MANDTLGSVLPNGSTTDPSDATEVTGTERTEADDAHGAATEAVAARAEQTNTHLRLSSLIGRSLLLDRMVYGLLLERSHPLLRGVAILLIVSIIGAMARVTGMWFDTLTTPRLDVLQSRIIDLISLTPWYQIYVAADPQLAANLEYSYGALWSLIMLSMGRPPLENPVPMLMVIFVMTMGIYLILWFLHGTVAHGVARWQGGHATVVETLGALGLAYSPILLTIFVVMPGLQIPLTLMFLLLFCTQYQAIRIAHGLSWSRTLASVAAPYLFWSILIGSVLLLIIGLQLSQLPYIDELINVLR